MLLYTLVDSIKEEFYRLAAEAKPRTIKQEFDRYIHFLHDYYNTILAVDLDKITLDHYRDGRAGDIAIISKRQYIADQFRYTATVLLDEDGIDNNTLLGTIDNKASALSIIYEEELRVVDETAQYEVDKTAQYKVDKTAQYEEELRIVDEIAQYEEELRVVDETATAKATAKARYEEELRVAEVENITTLFELIVRIASIQLLAKLYSLFNTTIEPQTPALLLSVLTKSSLFYLYTPTNPSPLRIQSALLLVANFDYSEFPSQLS